MNLRSIIAGLRKISFVKEIIFYNGEKNMIFANNYKIWEEGMNNNPIEEIYDIKIFEMLRKSYLFACA